MHLHVQGAGARGNEDEAIRSIAAFHYHLKEDSNAYSSSLTLGGHHVAVNQLHEPSSAQDKWLFRY